MAGAFGSQGTSGPVRPYPPEVSGPAPILIVTPRLVEIVALSTATELRKIMIAGATIIIAMTREAIRIRFFFPVIFKAHKIATMIAISKKRGCINVASENQQPTDATEIQNFLPIGLSSVPRIDPAIIMKHAAIGASYPTVKEASERVGLKVIIIETQIARNLSELLWSLFVKK